VEHYVVFIVGSGKLAEELLRELSGPAIARVVRWSERNPREDAPGIVVHAGSGRELEDVTGFCARTGSMLLDLSTEGSRFPETTGFPVVICPNVNMQMLRFMAMVRYASRHFRGQDITVAESHQASKSTRPGTAVYLARSLGVPEAAIRSERDPKVQQEVLGIPPAFLDRHALHAITVSTPEVEIRLEARVLGKSAYASGLAQVIDILVRQRPAPGFHDIVDLVIEAIGEDN
jgi:dihydrodipicolinate reductase